jgi:hypothetical protein
MPRKEKELVIYCIDTISLEAINRSFLNKLWQLLGTEPKIKTLDFFDFDYCRDCVLVGPIDAGIRTTVAIGLRESPSGYLNLHVNDIGLARKKMQEAGVNELPHETGSFILQLGGGLVKLICTEPNRAQLMCYNRQIRRQ